MVCRGPQRAWHVWRRNVENLGDPESSWRQVGGTETSSRDAEGDQGVGSVYSTQRR